jgi:hypothetical protein
MQGAAQLTAEAGSVNWFFQNFSVDGVLNLSPLGKIGQEFAAFSSQTDRGVPYAPVAIVMEPAHGFGESWHYQGLSWGVFPLTPQEEVLWLLFQSIFPKAWTPMNDFNNPKTSELGSVASLATTHTHARLHRQGFTSEVVPVLRWCVLTHMVVE